MGRPTKSVGDRGDRGDRRGDRYERDRYDRDDRDSYYDDHYSKSGYGNGSGNIYIFCMKRSCDYWTCFVGGRGNYY